MSDVRGLHLDGVGFTYEGAREPALSDVSALLPATSVVAVLGGQGCGKTTLLRAIAGSLGAIYAGISSGSLTLESGSGPSQPLRPDDVSSFFDSYVQVTLAAESVREEIGLPLLAQVVSEAERNARADAAAEELRIPHLLDRQTTGLSGGEEKLVGLAAALCADAPVYLLDEPFEQLDVTHLRLVVKAIRARARRGALVVVATAAVDLALNLADRLLVADATGWRTVASPSYGAIAVDADQLGSSQVRAFLGSDIASQSLDHVRTFRDAVAAKRSA